MILSSQIEVQQAELKSNVTSLEAIGFFGSGEGCLMGRWVA